MKTSKVVSREKKSLLKEVTGFYLNSGDFNGIPALQLADQLKKPWERLQPIAAGLIEEQLIGVLDTSSDINPAIIRTGFESIEVQIKKLDKPDLQHVRLYPRPAHLESVVDPADYVGRPYVLELAHGHPQFAFRSFDLSVLESYRNDPRYSYENRDIDGSISIRDEFYRSSRMPERDQVLLQSFGFSFDADLNRAVAVFLRYLAGLSAEHQQIWKAKELSEPHNLHPDYFRYSILGDWGERFPVFVAFATEMSILNRMAKAMGRPNLFKQDFGEYGENKPPRFTFLVRPTLEEFNEFVLLLDKMLSENLNKGFFRNDVAEEVEEERADGKIVIRSKGTLTILNDWLRKYFKTPEWELWEDSFNCLREIRQLRQQPAHALKDNVFDQKYIQDQRKLMIRAYSALRILRSMFARHPYVRRAGIEIPSWLEHGLIWTH